MIVSWRHKGLRIFFESGSTSGIRADQAKRLSGVLLALNRAETPDDVNLPGWRLHALKGEMSGFWSITVTANWRVIFRFVGADVELVNYLDYH
ncbi:type II toxin-antitoxin system RelE/ParE family toxin [Pseudomonas gingeri]|jgi:proteic killer suppression protein|uniref:Type II toxin-antitoxin system RelE/ParE family toxin n=1 Tax=Pseudomonas gingeri TaxID=117681 RepID=A0A7Y8C3N7_9PSED|nr:type II toxin-antitoxin system RelE/ParE family toxin [Pseudomonas gingeri]MBV6749493.1 type II toxin-antitoxin system RelE/ParE family toxin [Pseudomonas chlororaphis]NWB98775.1 type II toxin-antitoxin system RelE/ParE family toxin [Pseudomonas gingeri]NWD71090.1 type II toxin-antitoxin system RelE/ParE family toxin [Pseudomonas gingeri]NWD74196.1 type II toxin-antitoxin system RelE/ParE family toxin [Pseudomonas gingeri]